MKKVFFVIMILSLGAFFTGCASTRPQFGQAWRPAQASAIQNNSLAERLIARFGNNSESAQPTQPVPTKSATPTTKKVSPVAATTSAPVHKKTSVHKKHRRENSSLEHRVARLESRVNRNQNRVALLEDRFNRSPSGNIKAEKIHFYSGSAKLLPVGKKYFHILAKKYKNGTVRNIIITGHASKTRKQGVNNMTLSEKRALNAQSFLKKQGVEVQVRGAGETDRYTVNTNIIVTYEEKQRR